MVLLRSMEILLDQLFLLNTEQAMPLRHLAEKFRARMCVGVVI